MPRRHYGKRRYEVSRSERLVSVDFEISSTCQARCKVCQRIDEFGKLNDFVQTTKTLTEVIYILGDLVKQLKEVKLCGNYGDPMACEEVADICEWLVDQNPDIRIDIATNGAIGKPKTYARLGKIGVNITFGLDGSTQESNELYRVNVKWADAMKNLKAYSETSTAKDSGWQFLLFDQNKEHLEPAIKLAIEYGLCQMYINAMPNPFSSGIIPLKNSNAIIANDSPIQKLDMYDISGTEILYQLTPAFGMAEQVKQLKDKYATDMLFV